MKSEKIEGKEKELISPIEKIEKENKTRKDKDARSFKEELQIEIDKIKKEKNVKKEIKEKTLKTSEKILIDNKFNIIRQKLLKECER